MKTPKIVVPLIVIVGLGIGIYIWSKRDKDNKVTTITMGTLSKAYGNLPYHIAKYLKWFENDPHLKGITINYIEYNDRPSVSDALSNGSLQVLFSGDAPALLCRAQGNDIRTVTVSGNAEQEIVVHSESPIRSVSDLWGKKVDVLQGTSSYYALLKILKANNLNETNIQIQLMVPAEARIAFESVQIDAWAIWAPFVEQQQASGKGRVLTGSNALINSIMSVPTSFLAEHEPIVRAIASQIQRAKDWMIANPEEAQRIAVEELKLDPAVVKIAWPKFNWKAQYNDEIIEDLQDKVDFLAAAEKTRGSKTFNVKSDYVDTRFMNGAK